MTQYELIPTRTDITDKIHLQNYQLPSLVHLDDPAYAVMIDFSRKNPILLSPDENLDTALHEMKTHHAHVLLIVDNDTNVIGILSSEDILGEKPIKIIQELRIERSNILVKMIMTPVKDIVSFDFCDIKHTRVGNVVNTLKDQCLHYAMVIMPNDDPARPVLRGLFDTSQISKQLHMEVAHAIAQSTSVSELKHRHTKDD